MQELETIRLRLNYMKEKLVGEYRDIMIKQLKDANLDGEVENLLTGSKGAITVGDCEYDDFPNYQYRRYKSGTRTLQKYAESNIKDIETVKKFFKSTKGE